MTEKIDEHPDTAAEVVEDERIRWDKGLDFVLSCIGFAVGFGNIWRFPYLCYKNGGGAFFIPYILFMVFAGIPLFLLEVTIGQFMSYGGIRVWNICPIFKGIGLATTVIDFWLNQYYIVIIAWALFYFFSSFTTELPWSHCRNKWNTFNCTEFKSGYVDQLSNYTANETRGYETVSPVDEFWEREVLQITHGLSEMGGLRWNLVGTLLIAWVLNYFCIWKGVRSSGKVVYFTATFPYVIITILLIRSVLLEGAADGLIYYLKPDITRLRDAQVWVDAGTQVFFSYAIGIGSLTALGSYNKFNNNCYRDTMIVAFVNSFTSFYCGLLIFSVLGHMSVEEGLPISNVATTGPGLIFIAYPKAVSLMPFAPMWSCLFFFMLLLVGMDSQFVTVEGFVTAIADFFPRYLRRGYKREIFVLIVCASSFLFGLSMVTRGGMYVFQIYDYFSASGMVLLCMAFFECVAIGWIYGGERLYANMETMIGYRPLGIFKWCWIVFTPVISLAIWIFSVANWTPLKYENYVYPPWGVGIGMCMALSSMLCIPAWAIFSLANTEGSMRERLQKLTTPHLRPFQIVLPGKLEKAVEMQEMEKLS
ncbi:sodium- and chloride-dependent GABA transporter 3-like [Anneissia japonica]|uniref:sodium- and chloride-dependent GABA transporter 3-like n=1 Tax=Anneissia japonica TaxID=1529436 RepID=UPI0014258547|nr:sodium- and chloride-dependent GABA transporter 3-like [Anneissia japonica]XP_033121703.1 sodium- and chloride-dependent GABA transporter 3-like [Anneissia japonica]XP_033121704.1 sodium- and chloride-dependent GABA transporter 3-like [Anneissia japonica]